MALLTGEMLFPSFLQFEILNLPIPQVQSNSLHKPSPGEGMEGNGLEVALKSQSLLLTALGHCFWFWRRDLRAATLPRLDFRSHIS